MLKFTFCLFVVIFAVDSHILYFFHNGQLHPASRVHFLVQRPPATFNPFYEETVLGDTTLSADKVTRSEEKSSSESNIISAEIKQSREAFSTFSTDTTEESQESTYTTKKCLNCNGNCVIPLYRCLADFDCPPCYKCGADRSSMHKICKHISYIDSATDNQLVSTTSIVPERNTISHRVSSAFSTDTTEESQKIALTTEKCPDCKGNCVIPQYRCFSDSDCPFCYKCSADTSYIYMICKHVSYIDLAVDIQLVSISATTSSVSADSAFDSKSTSGIIFTNNANNEVSKQTSISLTTNTIEPISKIREDNKKLLSPYEDISTDSITASEAVFSTANDGDLSWTVEPLTEKTENNKHFWDLLSIYEDKSTDSITASTAVFSAASDGNFPWTDIFKTTVDLSRNRKNQPEIFTLAETKSNLVFSTASSTTLSGNTLSESLTTNRSMELVVTAPSVTSATKFTTFGKRVNNMVNETVLKTVTLPDSTSLKAANITSTMVSVFGSTDSTFYSKPAVTINVTTISNDTDAINFTFSVPPVTNSTPSTGFGTISTFFTASSDTNILNTTANDVNTTLSTDIISVATNHNNTDATKVIISNNTLLSTTPIGSDINLTTVFDFSEKTAKTISTTTVAFVESVSITTVDSVTGNKTPITVSTDTLLTTDTNDIVSHSITSNQPADILKPAIQATTETIVLANNITETTTDISVPTVSRDKEKSVAAAVTTIIQTVSSIFVELLIYLIRNSSTTVDKSIESESYNILTENLTVTGQESTTAFSLTGNKSLIPTESTRNWDKAKNQTLPSAASTDVFTVSTAENTLAGEKSGTLTIASPDIISTVLLNTTAMSSYTKFSASTVDASITSATTTPTESSTVTKFLFNNVTMSTITLAFTDLERGTQNITVNNATVSENKEHTNFIHDNISLTKSTTLGTNTVLTTDTTTTSKFTINKTTDVTRTDQIISNTAETVPKTFSEDMFTNSTEINTSAPYPNTAVTTSVKETAAETATTDSKTNSFSTLISMKSESFTVATDFKTVTESINNTRTIPHEIDLLTAGTSSITQSTSFTSPPLIQAGNFTSKTTSKVEIVEEIDASGSGSGNGSGEAEYFGSGKIPSDDEDYSSISEKENSNSLLESENNNFLKEA